MTDRAIAVLVFLSLSVPTLAQNPPQTGGWVVLPVGEYRALREKAYPQPPPPEPPPVNAAISRVEYDLNVQGEAAVGQARLTVDVFKDGWVSVPIPAGLRVSDAKIDGRPITLVERAEGRGASGPSVLLSRAGRSTVTLDLAVAIASKSGVESIALPASPSPVERVSLTLRSPDLALSVNGGFVAERTAAAQATRFLVCGRAGEPLGLSWSRRRDNPSASQPLRLRGSVTEIVGLAEDSAQVSAQVGVEVVQGLAERVTLKVPSAFAVSQVSGALVGDWEARGSDLVVSFLEPVERQTSVTVSGELRTARDGKIGIPIIHVGAAERETGGVAVEVLGAGEIKETSARGLDAADPSDLGAAVAARQSPALVAFRSRPQAFDAPRSLEVTVARYTPQAVLLANVDEARYTVLLTEDGKTLVEAAYAVRNSQRSFLAVSLPEKAALWTASIDGRPVRPGRTPEGALLLPILKDRASSAAASIVRLIFLDRATAWPTEGVAALRLPSVDLPVSRTGVQTYYPPRFRLKLEPGPFREEPYSAPQNAALAGRPEPRYGGGRGAPVFRAGVTGGVEGGVAGGVAGGIVGGLPEAPAPPGFDKVQQARTADQELRDLVTQFQRAPRAGGIAGLLPVEMGFPSLGPSIFVAGELTPESKTPDVRFTFKREVK